MKIVGLLPAAAAIDTDSALRVIRYFDALVDRRADVDELINATAELAQCPVCLDLGDRCVRSEPDPRLTPADPLKSTCRSFEVGAAQLCIWLERRGGPAALDELVLERASVAVKIRLAEPRSAMAAAPEDAALIETVLSDNETTAVRRRALRRLGLMPEAPLRVIAISVADGNDPAAAAEAVLSRTQFTRMSSVAVLSGVAVVLVQRGDHGSATIDQLRSAAAELTVGQSDRDRIHIGAGSRTEVASASRSWNHALAALRFALTWGSAGYIHHAGEAVIEYGELGAMALLASVPPDELNSHPEVAALNAMAATDAGAMDIAAVEAFFRTGTLRSTAQVLHLHHSTVAARLERVEQSMGWHLDEPVSRFQAEFALLARRLT